MKTVLGNDEKLISDIKNHFDNIKNNASVIENRLCDDCDLEEILQNNKNNLENALAHKVNYILIENDYLNEINKFLEV